MPSAGRSIKSPAMKITLIRMAAVASFFFFLASNLIAQTYTPPRTTSGDPDLQGIWQVRNTANWDLQHHSSSYKTPAGLGVVVEPSDGAIPYQPSPLDKKKDNFAKREVSDPVEKFYLAS